MTSSQAKSVIEEIGHTEAIIAKAKRYMPEHQDLKLIADYEAHLARLHAMLEAAAEDLYEALKFALAYIGDEPHISDRLRSALAKADGTA